MGDNALLWQQAEAGDDEEDREDAREDADDDHRLHHLRRVPAAEESARLGAVLPKPVERGEALPASALLQPRKELLTPCAEPASEDRREHDLEGILSAVPGQRI